MLEYYRAKWRLRKLIRCWTEYQETVVQALGDSDTNGRIESRFLSLKAHMAMLLQQLEDSLPASMAAEARREIDSMTNLLKSHRNLGNDAATEQWVRKEFGQLWHEHYIFLNRLLGVRLGHKRQNPNRAAPTAPSGSRKRWAPFTSATRRRLRLVGTLAVLCVVVVMASWIFGIHHTAGGRFVVDNDSGFGNFLESALNSAGGVSSVVVGFFDPVVDAYGSTWTLIMVGVLLLGSSLWIFARA